MLIELTGFLGKLLQCRINLLIQYRIQDLKYQYPFVFNLHIFQLLDFLKAYIYVRVCVRIYIYRRTHIHTYMADQQYQNQESETKE